MSTIFENVTKDIHFQATTGLTRTQFERLRDLFSETEMQVIDPDLSRPRTRSYDERLFLVLYYLKTYLSLEVLGINFGLSRSEAERVLKRDLNLLQRTLRRNQDLPLTSHDDLEDLQAALAGQGELFVDATERPRTRPKDSEAQKAAYSGKKKPIRRKIP